MPGPQAVVYNVAAAASTNVIAGSNGGLPGSANEQFNVGALPQPLIDAVNIQNGQYFLLTNQTNPNFNGIWFADPSGPVPVMTVGAGPGAGGTSGSGLNPNVTVIVGPGVGGSQNGGTTWVYTPNYRNITITPGEGTVPTPGFVII
jgi:hypothetical protein